MDTLDERLASMAQALPAEAENEAHRMARATAPTRRKRARWMLPALVGGAVVLTAGTSIGVATMSHWAGVEMPLENVRNEQPIPLNWVTESGHSEQCRAWIEIRNPQDGDQASLDTAILAHNWTGLGQRMYDDGTPEPDDADGEGRVGAGLEPVLRAFAEDTFPGIAWLNANAGTTTRAVAATGFTCVPDVE